MTMTTSSGWFRVFPGPRIPDVLTYVFDTWLDLQRRFASSVSFAHDETALTDNLCEALEDSDRRMAAGMDCDFQPETWELRRLANGSTTRVARADIRVILGAPGTPHLVMEFKKLDGNTDSRWRYCFDGMNRFVEGKYAQGHTYGVMCGFTPIDLNVEAGMLASYIDQAEYRRRLRCVPDGATSAITVPSQAAPTFAKFDTDHDRSGIGGAGTIKLLHALMACPLPPVKTATSDKKRGKASKKTAAPAKKGATPVKRGSGRRKKDVT